VMNLEDDHSENVREEEVPEESLLYMIKETGKTSRENQQGKPTTTTSETKGRRAVTIPAPRFIQRKRSKTAESPKSKEKKDGNQWQAGLEEPRKMMEMETKKIRMWTSCNNLCIHLISVETGFALAHYD